MAVGRNRNARRTQQMIRDALISLVEKGKASSVNVASICREAGINRSTFYGHYDNVEDMCVSLSHDLSDRFLHKLKDVMVAQTAEEATELIMQMGHEYEEGLPLYDALVQLSGTDHTGMDFRGDLIQDNLINDLGYAIVSDFFLSSIMAIYHTWAVGMYGDVGVDEVSTHVARLVVGALGLSD